MKVWIVYDTKYGNNQQIAETIQDYFNKDNETQVAYAKDISPQAIIDSGVDLLILGGPLRFGAPSSTMKRWTNKMETLLNKKKIALKKVAIWGTHLQDPPNAPPGQCSWDLAKEKWKKILGSFPADKKPIDVQGFAVDKISGPNSLEVGWKNLVEQFAIMVKNL